MSARFVLAPDGTTAIDRRDGQRVLVAQARWSRDADLVVDCPLCHGKHRHGRAGEGGLRLSHCAPPHVPQSYLLLVSSQRARAGGST